MIMSNRNIEDLSPLFQKMVRDLLSQGQVAINTTGYTFFITDGFRSNEEQTKLYAQGRTAPGKIVTNAKAGESAHSFGLAVDCAFQRLGKLYYTPSLYAKIYPIARALGFELGADWTSFSDKPHFQYPHWENHKKPTETSPSSDVPSELLQWGKNSLKDLNDYIVFLREDSKALADLKIVADERKSLIEWIAEKLGCSGEYGVIKSEIEKLLTMEGLSEDAQKNLKKTIEEKDIEIAGLKGELRTLREECAQLKETHNRQIDTVTARVDTAISKTEQAVSHKKQLNFLQQILQGLKSLGKKK